MFILSYLRGLIGKLARTGPILYLFLSLITVSIFSEAQGASNFSDVDEILRQSGTKRKDFRTFKSMFEFRNNPTTNGMLYDGQKNIVAFRLIGGSIDSLTYVSKLKHLQILNLFDNKIASLKGIGRISQLQYLDVAENNISDFSALLELDYLDVVHLEINKNNTLIPYSFYWGHKTATLHADKSSVWSKFEIEEMYSPVTDMSVITDKNRSARKVGPDNMGKVIGSLQTNLPKGKMLFSFSVGGGARPSSDKLNAFKLSITGNKDKDGATFSISHDFKLENQHGFNEYSFEVNLPDLINGASIALYSQHNSGEILYDYMTIKVNDVPGDEIRLYDVLKELINKNIKQFI